LEYIISKSTERRSREIPTNQNATFDEDIFGMGKGKIFVRTLDVNPPLGKTPFFSDDGEILYKIAATVFFRLIEKKGQKTANRKQKMSSLFYEKYSV